MKAFESFNGCKVYNLSAGKTMPEWLSTAKKRALLKDEEYRKRLELIQDFEMPTSSQCLKMTADGQHLILTGVYPPLVRCFTTTDLAMKFQRGLTCEVVAMETLSDDFGKLVFLQADRTLNFHAPYGTHYSLRIPKFGRDLLYNPTDCDLYVAASGDELYRLNLERGQFREPFSLCCNGCNKLHMNPVHQLLACGGDHGICEFWDPRSRTAVARISTESTLLTTTTSSFNESTNNIIDRRLQHPADVTQVQFDSDGLTFGVGMYGGQCNFYDIRSRKPFYVKEHQYGLPIVDITYHGPSRHIITADKKVVKIWSRDEPDIGNIMTNIETPADINNLVLIKDQRGPTGLLMMTGEQTRVMTYFVPQLGPAPRWCSFLESLTEELEETTNETVYDDYKFLTRKEVDELGATGLIGTPSLKGYMHGFFMELKLYHELRAVSKPFEYEEHRKRKIQEKIEAKRQSRITAVKRLPKVNAALAEKLMGRSEKKDTKENGAIIDDRFASLFEREEFQQDVESEAFKLRNPVQSKKHSASANDSDDELANDENFSEQDIDSYNDLSESNGGESESDDDEDNDFIEKISAEKHGWGGSGKKTAAKKINDDEDGPIARMTRKIEEKRRQKESQFHGQSVRGSKSNIRRIDSNHTKRKAPEMYALADGIGGASGGVFGQSDEKKAKRLQQTAAANVPFAERLQQQQQNDTNKNGSNRNISRKQSGTTREFTYMPSSNNKKPSMAKKSKR